MPTIILSDLMKHCGFRVTPNGEEATRAYVVLVEASLPGYARLAAAATCPGLPIMGDPHPSDDNIVATLIDPSPYEGEDNLQYLVKVEYKPKSVENTPPSAVGFSWVTVSATVENKEQFVDNQGNQLLVSSTGNEDQPNSAQVTVCNPILVCERREPPPMNIGKVLAYVGAVNSVSWVGAAPRTWKCIAIEPRWDGGIKAIRWVYKFQYNRDTWDVVLFYKDPLTRNVILTNGDGSALSEGNGYQTFRVYTEMDFNRIPLP